MLRSKCPKAARKTVRATWRFEIGVTCSVRVAPATIRQAFRFPDDASTATISGCKSSVREITGNNSASVHPIAIDSRKTRARGFGRDASQRKRHIHRAASARSSQSKLSSVSIVPARSKVPSGKARHRQPVENQPYSPRAKSTTRDAVMQFAAL
jgi:hypothetical protein